MAPTKTCSSAGAANSEEATAEKKKIQAALKNKCSAKEIFEIMEFLKDKTAMMEAVEEMGLGSLKYLPVVDMKLKFAKELLDAFDVSSCSIFGESIKAEDVNRILGNPSTGKSAPTDISSDKKETLKEKFVNKSVSQLREDIKGFKSVDDTFRETFFLFVLARFLCPTSKDFPSTKLYKALQVVSNARQYNWGEFVLAWLVKHISDCKEKGASHNVGVGGCIYFLMIFVLQWKYPQHIDDSKPVMSTWTKKKITSAIKKWKKNSPSGKIKSNDNEGNKVMKKWSCWWKGNLDEYSYIVLPICTNKHFSLVIICFIEREVPGSILMLHMDSYSDSHCHSSVEIFDIIEWGLKQMCEGAISTFPNTVKKTVEVPQQPNGHDCGLFVMHMMELFLKQAPEQFRIDYMKMFYKFTFLLRA